jgi:hypothetical protein
VTQNISFGELDLKSISEAERLSSKTLDTTMDESVEETSEIIKKVRRKKGNWKNIEMFNTYKDLMRAKEDKEFVVVLNPIEAYDEKVVLE